MSASILDRVPVPRPPGDCPALRRIAALCFALETNASDRHTAARLQASVARLYALTADEFDHVLGTFPLVAEADRQLAAEAFRA